MSLSERDQEYLKYLDKHLREEDPSLARQFEPPSGSLSEYLPTAAIAGLIAGIVFGLWFGTFGGGIIIGVLAMIVAVVYSVNRAERPLPGSRK